MSGRILPFPSRERPSIVGLPTSPFVRRATELSFLHQRLEAALQGRRQVVLLVGEPGIGKTSLVDAFLGQLRNSSNLLTATGHCVEQYGPGEAYLPLLEAITCLCRGPNGKQCLALLRQYAPSWLAQLPSLLDPQDFSRLQQQVQGTSRERMLREMAEVTEELSQPNGLVLVLEDLHWSDVSTVDWLAYMAQRREPAKVLIIGAYRPMDALASGRPLSGTVQELQGRNQCEELRLAPLIAEGIAEYLTERFTVTMDDLPFLHELAVLLHRRTGGNPLFLVNTVDYLIQHGAMTAEAGQWTLHPEKIKDIDDSIPDTIRLFIARQAERLPDAEQRLLEAASVAGTEFAVAEIAAGLQVEAPALEALCERLARTGQFIRASGLAEWPDGTISGRYSFLHALYHEVLYSRLAELLRVQMHRRIAERKERAYGERAGEIAAELAAHWEKGREFTRAVHYLGKAGENAVRRSAHKEAIALLTQGLALLPLQPDSPERLQQELQLQLALGVSFINTKGPAAVEVEHAYARVWDISQRLKHTPQLFTALWGLSASWVVRSKFDRALTLAEQMLAIAERAQDAELQMEASLMAGVLHLYSHGDTLVARRHLQRVIAIYNPERHRTHAFRYGQDPGIFGWGLAAIALWCAGYPDQAHTRAQEALAFAQLETAPYDQSIALIYNAFLHQHRGEGSLVRTPAEAVVKLTTEQGFRLVWCWGTVLHGWTLVEEGQADLGIAAIRSTISAQQEMGAEFLLVYFLSLLAEAHWRAGHYEEGLRVIDEALMKVETTGARLYEAELYRIKGELTLQQRFHVSSSTFSDSHLQHLTPSTQAEEEAESYFLKAIAIAQRQHAKSWELRAAMSLARLWGQQDKKDHARELLESVYAWFTEGFATKDLQDAETLLRALGSTVKRREVGRDLREAVTSFPRKRESRDPALDTAKRRDARQSLSRAKPKGGHDEHVKTGQQQTRNHSPSHEEPPAASRLPSPALNVFRKEGDYWTIAYQGTSFRLRHLRGLDYVARLLRHPGVEFLALDLLTPAHEPVTLLGTPQQVAGGNPSTPHSHLDEPEELLDAHTRATYRRRLEELREELAEAQAFNDLGRRDKVQQEMDFLSAELARALGLRGKPRTVSTAAERARVNVAKGVKIALAKIAEQCPPLEHHLATAIKTGLFCSYAPPPFDPIAWEL